MLGGCSGVTLCEEHNTGGRHHLSCLADCAQPQQYIANFSGIVAEQRGGAREPWAGVQCGEEVNLRSRKPELQFASTSRVRLEGCCVTAQPSVAV